MVLPITFVLMSVRILINNYRRLVRGEEIIDPEQVELDKMAHDDGGRNHG